MDAAQKHEQNKKKIMKIGQELTEWRQFMYSTVEKNW